MKLYLVILLIIPVFGESQYCYNDVVGACSPRGVETLANCNAQYGAINQVLPELQSFASAQISYSFHNLLMSTHFGNYKQQRKGFEKLFRSYSDSLWTDGIELIKYINKRGGVMNFTTPHNVLVKDDSYDLSEISSVARALDIYKALNNEVSNIHSGVSRTKTNVHDPEISSHIENFYMEQYRSKIRDLSGHISDLTQLLTDKDRTSLNVFIFDEILQ